MGMYSGQGANAFVTGMQQGYSFIDDAYTNKESREQRAQAASMAAEQHKEVMKQQTQLTEQGEMKTNAMEAMNTKLTDLEKQVKANDTSKFRAGMNSVIGGKDPVKSLDHFMKTEANNPAFKSAGLQNPKSVRIPNGKNKSDRDKVLNTLLSEGYNFEGYSQDEVTEITDLVGASGLYVEADGHMLNVESMSVITGGAGTMTPEEQEIKDTRVKEIENVFSVTQDKVDTRVALEADAKNVILKEKIAQQAELILGKTRPKKEEVEGEAGPSASDRVRMLEDMIATATANGEEIPAYLQNALDDAKINQSLEIGGKAAGKSQLGVTRSLAQARKNPAYEGEAADIEYAENVEATTSGKALGKKWNDKVQPEQEMAESWVEAKDRTFQIIDENKLELSAFENIKSKVASYLDEDMAEKFRTGTPAEKAEARKQILAKAQLDSAIGAPMVAFIKHISGAAVSNEEREYLTDLVFGGDWKTTAQFKTRLNEFVDGRIDAATALLDDEGMRYKPNRAKLQSDKLKRRRTDGSVTDAKLVVGDKSESNKTPEGHTIVLDMGTVNDYAIGSKYKDTTVINRDVENGLIQLKSGQIVKLGE